MYKSFIYIFKKPDEFSSSESNNSASELVLNTVRDSISKYPFKFNRSNARIISGAEEGTFSWITSNYIAGVFHVVRWLDSSFIQLVSVILIFKTYCFGIKIKNTTYIVVKKSV